MLNPWPHTLSVAVALATLASPALVQAQSLSFNLPAGPLARTLNAIASQSGQIISLDPALVRDKLAPAVIGQMPIETQYIETGHAFRLAAYGQWMLLIGAFLCAIHSQATHAKLAR